MKFTKILFTAGAISLTSVAGAALAQDPVAVEVAVGTTVYGPEGDEVGTIEAVAEGVATLDTGKHKIGLPLDRFGQDADQQTTIAATRDELNEMVDQELAQTAAQLDAVLVAGMPVVDIDGTEIGSVGAVEGNEVTIETEWGAFALEKRFFLPGEDRVTAQVEAEQVRTALGAS